MKKLSMLILMLAMIAVLAVSASASIVMFQDGAANMKTAEGSVGALNLAVTLEEPINVYDYDYMYIRFYVEDPSLYQNNGQIEITSSGDCDKEEANWDLNSMEMVQGWNEWKIDLFAAGSSGGMVDYEKVNFFRIYFFTNGLNLVALDYVAFGTEEDDFSSIKTEFAEEIVLEAPPIVDTVVRVGEAESGAPNTHAVMYANPVNISDYDYVFLRIYVEGVENFATEGQLELTSSGTCDVQELFWNVGNIGLENGWNEIMLDLYLPDGMGADFNWEACNYYRMYQFVNGPAKFELDYIGFGMEDDVFGEDTLPAYLVKPASQDPVVEETEATEEAAEATEEATAEATEEATEATAEAAEEAAAEEAAAEEAVETVSLADAANGVYEATEGFANEGADMLFDGDENTKWCLAGTEAYVIWKTDAVTASAYEIVTANDNAEFTGRNPGAWTLSGSNDGETWTVIDAVEADTVLQDVNFTPFTFEIDAPAEYSMYKFEVSAVASGTLQISGLNLITGDAAAAEEVTAPAEPAEETVVAEAPQTFDAAIIAAVAAIVSAAGYAISKKR